MPTPESKTQIFLSIFDRLLENIPLKNVYFGGNKTTPPLLSYVVNFPRLSLPIKGEHGMEIETREGPKRISTVPGDAVFVEPNCWNKPTWDKPVEVVSFLFGKQHTGITHVVADGTSEYNLQADKISFSRQISGPGEKIINTIIELRTQQEDFEAYPQLIEALLGVCRNMVAEAKPVKKSRETILFDEICTYLQENFQYEITRSTVARHFNFTPNHLSRIFKQEGAMRFIDYLTYVRIDRAKFMLSKYDMKLEEIAQRCGYSEAGYFCRIFKKITKKTPSEYKFYIRNRR